MKRKDARTSLLSSSLTVTFSLLFSLSTPPGSASGATQAGTDTPTVPALPASQGITPSRAATTITLGPFKVPPPRPGEKPLLRLEGPQRTVTLTLSQLEALPRAQLKTTHAQLKVTAVYDGVLLRTLARALNFNGQDMRVYASNGFVNTISARDYLSAPIMLADHMDGKPISVLNKGPLTIVLPSDNARFRDKGSYWVWFVNRITPAPQP